MPSDPPPFDPRPQYDAAPSIPGLAHIALEETAVVDVRVSPTQLRVVCHAYVLPGHPEHRPHGPELWGDFHWGELTVELPEETVVDHEVGPAGAYLETQDYGDISALRWDGEWIELNDGSSIRWRGGTARFELWPPDASPPGSG